MIKWLDTLTVTEEEGDNHYHIFDNRVFPKHIDSKDVATAEGIWKSPLYTINDRNIQSATWAPAHCAKLKVSNELFTVSGYAYAGAGRPVHRVEVTVNNGQNWRNAAIDRFEKPDEFGQCWCWVFWSVQIPISVLAECGEFAVRAWDDSQNCQPERPTWNLMGMMNNPWFRIKVHSLSTGEIWFEHPTQVDNRHSIDKSAPLNPQNEELHLLANGDLASPGWMERMVVDVQAVYAPGKPEALDQGEGWEREKQHIIGAKKEVQKPQESCCVAGLQALLDRLRGDPKAMVKKTTPAAAAKPTVPDKVFTKADVAKHKTAADCWIIVNGQVLDVSSFLSDHPGGDKAILMFAGRDASAMFNPIHAPEVIPKFAPKALIGTVAA